MLDGLSKLWLAPLTKGGNLPFRRLCVDFGAEVTMSEMAYSRQLVKGSRSEFALLRRHESEKCFGVQIAASKPEDAAEATRIALDKGADFVDLNCGCPIHDTVKRGMGATLLQRTAALGRIVTAMVDAAAGAPVTVKIRTGWKEGKENAAEIAKVVEDSGAAMLAVHGRTKEQRYSRAADWQRIAELVEQCRIPVIGNGDILTWYEAQDRLEQSRCIAVMTGRGALIKPWLFREFKTGQDWLPSTAERLEVLLRFASYLREHFGDDDRGRGRAMRFLPWHLGFLARWRPLPVEQFHAASREHPLLQTRDEDTDMASLEPVERLLRDPREAVHAALAEALWAAADVDALQLGLEELAATTPPPDSLMAGEVKTSHG